MRVLACVLAAFVVLVPAAGATPPGLKLLVRDGSKLSLVYVDRATPFVQPLRPAKGTLGFSGDGRLISIGGTILGRASLPGASVVWAPTGERAAVTTRGGGVAVWTPAGRRVAVPNGWNAEAIAWSADGALSIGRLDRTIWVWRAGRLTRVLGPIAGIGIPMPVAWSGGRILWWDWPDSGSIAADGVTLYADAQPLGTALMYRDYVAACGSHLAFAAGSDRYSTHGKWIDYDGRDVSRDPSRSWVTPSCTADGRLVAAAGRNTIPARTDETHRAIWQLRPTRRQLTRPPWGWSDEDPRVFPNGDVVFVRSRATSTKSTDREQGRVMLLSHGKLRETAHIGFVQPWDVYTYPVQYYGHYDWSQLLAVSP